MKKILLLALMTVLVHGECRKSENVDKMTDETRINFTCSSSSETGAIAFMVDETGSRIFAPKKTSVRQLGMDIKLYLLRQAQST